MCDDGKQKILSAFYYSIKLNLSTGIKFIAGSMKLLSNSENKNKNIPPNSSLCLLSVFLV